MNEGPCVPCCFQAQLMRKRTKYLISDVNVDQKMDFLREFEDELFPRWSLVLVWETPL